jgi:hypothetical protein
MREPPENWMMTDEMLRTRFRAIHGPSSDRVGSSPGGGSSEVGCCSIAAGVAGASDPQPAIHARPMTQKAVANKDLRMEGKDIKIP